MAKLTPKQEKFVQAYLRTGSPQHAYGESYSVKKMSNEAIRVEGYRQLQNPNIALRIQELQERVTKKTERTVESVDQMFQDIFDAAMVMKDKNLAAANGAAMGIAKLNGLIINKSEDVTPRRSSAEILARLRQLTSAGDAGRDTDVDGGSGAGETEREAVPTVPGHGTA